MEDQPITRPRVILDQSDYRELCDLMGTIRLARMQDGIWGFQGAANELAQFIIHLRAVTGNDYEALLLACGVIEYPGVDRDHLYLLPGLEVL